MNIAPVGMRKRQSYTVRAEPATWDILQKGKSAAGYSYMSDFLDALFHSPHFHNFIHDKRRINRDEHPSEPQNDSCAQPHV